MEKHKHDRSYYRMLTNDGLVDHVIYGNDVNWHELAIVLAERLEGEQRKSHDAYDD